MPYGTQTFGDLVIDLDTDTATKAGQPHTLTPTELILCQGQRDSIDMTAARRAADLPLETCRDDLAEVLALVPLYPAPTPEETALIDTQVVSALSAYRALVNPPADIVGLAAAVVSWRSEL